MEPNRVASQLEAAACRPWALIGSRFVRVPADATERYARWCNSLSQEQLMLQRFKELTVIQPTWFMSRQVFDSVGGYLTTPNSPNGESKVLAEDLDFFYRHIEQCSQSPALYVVEKKLVKYRQLDMTSASFGTPRKLLFRIKVAALERSVLPKWERFTIWGAGRDGKDLFKMLSPKYRARVEAMCDIDPKKIKQGYHNKQLKTTIPVVHFSQAKPPIVCCVAMDRGGEFEANLALLNLVEGVDYYHFV